MSDYHLHLHPHQPTNEGPPPGVYPESRIEAYVEAAARHGVAEIGFTEHLYRCVEAAPIIGPFWERSSHPVLAAQARALFVADLNLSLERYVEVVVAARDRGLPVLLGLEVDFFPDSIEQVVEFLQPFPWDYLIGSVHFVDGWSYDSPEVIAEFTRRGIRQAWADYFEWETALAASGAVDVLAHVDVIKKLGHRPSAEPLDLYRRVVEAAAKSGTAVEVSSQGLRFPIKEVYPGPTLLRMFQTAGVAITLASDAHRPSQAGWGHTEVVMAARAAGYRQRLRFRRRSRELVPLP